MMDFKAKFRHFNKQIINFDVFELGKNWENCKDKYTTTTKRREKLMRENFRRRIKYRIFLSISSFESLKY